MDRQKVERIVRNIVAEQLGFSEDEIKPTSNFIEDLGADSLDLVEMLIAAEDEFAIEVSDEDAEGWRTVGDAIDFIAAHAS